MNKLKLENSELIKALVRLYIDVKTGELEFIKELLPDQGEPILRTTLVDEGIKLVKKGVGLGPKARLAPFDEDLDPAVNEIRELLNL